MDDAAATALVEKRAAARRSGDFVTADAIRKTLHREGILVFDRDSDATSHGSANASSKWIRVAAPDGVSQHTRCMVWSHRKLAFCNGARVTGEWFCSAHVKAGLKGRVPCPLDPRHHLKPAKLAAHLGVCQSKPGTTALLADADKTKSSAAKADAGRIYALCKDPAALSQLAKKIDSVLRSLGALTAATTLCPSQSSSIAGSAPPSLLRKLPEEHRHANVNPAAASGAGVVGVRRAKETPQQESILNHLFRAGQLDETEPAGDAAPTGRRRRRRRRHRRRGRVVACELCAGKGRLSLGMRRKCGGTQHDGLDFFLVDRAARRNVVDQQLLVPDPPAKDSTNTVRRLTKDIADVRLDRLPEIAARATSTICVFGKHLCGAAADLSVSACLELSEAVSAMQKKSETGAGDDEEKKVVAVCFALCCHHLCAWECVAGRGLLEAHGIDEQDFALMKRLCTFYRKRPTGKVRVKKRKDNVTTEEEKGGDEAGVVSASVSAPEPPPPPAAAVSISIGGRDMAMLRHELGIKCKRLINECRVAHLRDGSGDFFRSVRLVEFVGESVTPENTLLVATSCC